MCVCARKSVGAEWADFTRVPDWHFKLQSLVLQSKIVQNIHTVFGIYASLSTRDEFGGEGLSETVVDGWVSDVSLPVGDWSLSGDNSLNVESEHGEHSETAVLDLLDLELSEGIRVISQTKRVELVSCSESRSVRLGESALSINRCGSLQRAWYTPGWSLSRPDPSGPSPDAR